MPHISKRRNQINNLSRKKGHFITQDETQEVTEVQNESTLRMGKEDEIGTLSVKRVYFKDSRTTIWSNMLFDTEASINMLLDAEVSSNMLLNTEASSNILLDTKASSNMLLDAEASSNMLPNDEASNDTLLDAKASSNISLLQSSHKTLQSPSSPTDTASILCIRLDDINKQCQIKKLSKSRHTKDIISKKTCHTYMYALGYKYDERKKGVYYDGHEWLDVVIVEPELEYGKKESVQVIHDEYHFYANDGQHKIWTRKDEDVLCSKHIGYSIMVSAFVYPWHGLLQLSKEQFLANPHIKYRDAFVDCFVQEDGYWKSEHIKNELEDLDCYAWKIILLQPDFCEQLSLLEEAIAKKGYIFEQYPKFHCECNFIEQYWGFVK
ncbi:16024_t:CDS:2 [Dentiscutata heterogama]|uniref:16024_t:CDS:1 n=1 Tax=Dentiscutata heterogama TaxID=1316150 RepID=A0ACA9LNB9_9GLOM|nr:16024_t:CDS:2 [Dentiscutata heterogama]